MKGDFSCILTTCFIKRLRPVCCPAIAIHDLLQQLGKIQSEDIRPPGEAASSNDLLSAETVIL